MPDIAESTLADLFAFHVAVLLRNPNLSPHVKIEQVVAAAKELHTADIMPKRGEGRPSNADKELQRLTDPFLVPLLGLVRAHQRQAIAKAAKALRAGDSAEQAVADLMEGKIIQDGGG